MHYGLIFANGDLIPGKQVRSALQVASQSPDTLIIAADGGLRHLRQLELKPHLVIGDMDSLTESDLQAAERDGAAIRRFPTHKDETDLELALIAAADRGCDSIIVIGGLGDRFDHSISNVYLLALPQLRGLESQLVSGDQSLRLIFPGEHQFSGHPGDTLSLIPVAGTAAGIVTGDLEYPLRHEALHFGPARGVSNVFLKDSATVKFDSGVLLVVHIMK
ncbi:MAG: thiamine diphosphokinase [Anaerolineae bacterium]